MNAKYTPGPWAIDPDDRPGMGWNNHIVRLADPNIAICFMSHSGRKDNSQCEANARLIAKAPELLECLRELFEHCAMTHKVWGDGCNQKQADAAIEKGRALLAEIEGKS